MKNSKEEKVEEKGYLYRTEIATPLGRMIAIASAKGICLLDFEDHKDLDKLIKDIEKERSLTLTIQENDHLVKLRDEIERYFSRKLISFSVQVDFIGTPFQIEAWNELLKIPYGATISYMQQAINIGRPQAIRAIANANSRNKIAIIVPCHRVIGSNGALTGYTGGIERKRFLINHEQNKTDLFNENY